MLRKHIFTLCVLSLLVMGEAVTARAGDSTVPSYPDWAAAVVPVYPHALPSSGPVIPTMYGIATTDPMPTVVALCTNPACTAHGREAKENIRGL